MKANETPKLIFNPSKENFTINWDGKPVTINSQEIGTFPTWLADHIAKHLCQKLVLERGIKTNYEDDYNETMKEIEVIL